MASLEVSTPSMSGMIKVDQSKEFADGFFTELQQMKGRKYLTNFTVKVQDAEIPCHNVILAARSQYFSRLFDNIETKEMQQGFVVLESLQFSAVQRVIDYCYSGVLEVHVDDAKHVIEADERLQIPLLKSVISKLVETNLTVENCIGWYWFAYLFGMQEVREKSGEIMFIDLASAVKVPEFFELSYQHLVEYISWEDIDRSSALIAAASWIVHDIEDRKHKFTDIVQLIDITCCSSSGLKHIITEYGSQLLTSSQLKQQFVEALLNKVPDWQAPGRGAGYDIIVMSGEHGNYVNSKVWTVNLKTGHVVQKSDCPTCHSKLYIPAVCDTSDGVMCAAGACKRHPDMFSDPSAECSIYRQSEDTWASLPNLPSPIMGASAVCVGKCKVFLMGSWCGINDSKMYCLDLTTNIWTTCPDMLQGMEWPTVVSINDCIYVMQVNVKQNFNSVFNSEVNPELSLQRYDCITSTWEFMQSLPEGITKTKGACAVAVDRHLYVVGGAEDICLRYNTDENTWAVLTSPLQRHLFGAAVHMKGKIILSGGKDSANETCDIIESYDPSTDTWKILPVKLPQAVWHHHITVLNVAQ